jgi:hypothetical protein
MLFKEIVAVYSQNDMKNHKNQIEELRISEAVVTYS